MSRALEGVKICDLMWVLAGPTATRLLSDFGATVVRVESRARPDPARAVGPHRHDTPGINSSALWQNSNAGKRGLGLDLSKPGAKAVLLDLVRWADVITESFSPGTMDAWGLGYAELKAVNPHIIFLSTCLMGQSGPYAELAGFGNLSAAVTGFYGLCGWPDRSPSGPYAAYTDYIAPKYIAIAILAALEYRRRTNKGQYIDLAQAESALHFLAPALVDRASGGEESTRVGNRDAAMAPHGVYPTHTPDQWIAIACADDAQWRALCVAIGMAQLQTAARFRTLALRLKNHEMLDATIGEWTRGQNADTARALLQRHGIACGRVQRSDDCARDPQLRFRDHFVAVPGTDPAEVVVEAPRFKLSASPANVARAAPCFGEHNDGVLSEILGYSRARIEALTADGIVGQ